MSALKCTTMAALAGSLASIVANAGTNTAVELSAQPMSADAGWHQYVLAVPGEFVEPREISVEGDPASVTNTKGLLGSGGGHTTLTTIGSGTSRIIVDLGVPASGYVEIGVTRAAGAPIRLSYSEDRHLLRTEGDGSNDPNDFFYKGRTLGTDDDPDSRADVFAPPAEPQTLRSPGLRGSQRYIAITLDGPGSVTLDFIRVRQINFKPAQDGYFLSSDRDLNRAWYASAYATQLSTARDTRRNPHGRWVLMDGAKRDRTVYGANIQISGLAAYYQSSGYRDVVRDSIRLFSCQQSPDGSLPPTSLIDVPCEGADLSVPKGPPAGFEPPAEAGLARIDSYSAWWVISLAEYLRYTGDVAFVRQMLPVARRVLQFFANHTDGGALWKAGDYDKKLSFDWHPPDRAVGADAFINEIYYGALLSLARLERTAAHDPHAAQVLERRASAVKLELLGKMWDSTVGAMVLNPEDPRHDHTADANVGALVFGLLSDDQAHRAMLFLESKLQTPFGTANSEFSDSHYITQYVSPWIVAHEAVARFRYGDGKGGLRLIRTTWTHMLDYGPGTPWEEMSVQGTPQIPRPGTSLVDGNTVSRAHPWSTAVPALSNYVLGVRPLTDGFTKWEIAPQPVDLSWAQGDVPTPKGTLSVRWKRAEEDSLILSMEAPTGTTGQVAIPLEGTDGTIAMDGTLVWDHGKPTTRLQGRRDGDRIVFTGVTGKHTFARAR